MEFRRQEEGYHPPPPPPLLPPPSIIRESAFTRPSSLVVSPRGPPPTRNGAPSKDPDPVPPSAPPLPATPSTASSDADAETRYRECLRNHAAAVGGHVLDGCGEFMSGAGSDAMKCAACSCHRSFHRKDSAAGEHSPIYRLLLPPPPPLAHHKHFFPPGSPAIIASGGTTTESSSEELHAAAVAAAVAQPSKKRHRTKFTAIQKERMLGFAEKVNWRIQKQEEVEMERFCAEIGVSRQVLKVWMHNNKHSINRKPQLLEPQQQQQLHHQQQQQQQT